IFNHDSAIASAASRMVQVSKQSEHPITLTEMGSRRTQESSAITAARAAYLVGFDNTSNTQASFQYNIPLSGTSAHAYTLAHEHEYTAFKQQVQVLGQNTTLLVDTYN